MPPNRCDWCGSDPLYIDYHDTEWGVPLHDERRLFEMLILEGAQAGLSWLTVLRKRPAYRQAFDHFDAEAIAAYDDARVAALLDNSGIIRNRLKIRAAIRNARATLEIREAFGSFDAFLWRFVDGTPVQNHWPTLREVPCKSPLSDTISKELKKRDMSFVGSTIVYAYMQAIGMVNDHLTTCFRHPAFKQLPL